MLPDYTIRESRRAKHVLLRLSVTGELEVVVPSGYDRQQIPAILTHKQAWIDRVKQRMNSRLATADSKPHEIHPARISLPAIGETWQVEYRSTRQPYLKLREYAGKRLILAGATHDWESCKKPLREWIATQAQRHLIPWLQAISQELNLTFSHATIRRQKTLWGSCTSRKTISLNSKLLFLSEAQVRYVLIHELCHTVHLNHSPDFWALVGHYEPNYRSLDVSLRDARYRIPHWME